MGISKKGQIVVTLGEDGIIYCELTGYITGDLVRESVKETAKYVSILHQKSRKALLLIDLAGVTVQTSEARVESKKIGKIGVDKIAISGASKALTIVGQYILKAGGMSKYSRFVRNRKKAIAWLKDSNVPLYQQRTRFAVAAWISLIAMGVIVGWATDNTALKSVLEGLNSMNPVNAVNFLLLALVLILFKYKKQGMSRLTRTFITGVGMWCIVYAAIVVVRNALNLDIPVDRWLFTDKLNVSNGIAPNAALDYLLTGGMILIVLTGQSRVWQQYVYHIFSTILIVTTLGAIVGISFKLEVLYSGNFVPMALNTAVCFLLFNHGLATVSRPLPFFKALWGFTHRFWQPVLLMGVLMFFVGFSWQQSVQDLQKNTTIAIKEEFNRTQGKIKDQFNVYESALQGYKGFFEASETVSALEFRNYFVKSQPPNGLIGFSGINFTRSIPAAQQGQFITNIKQQASASGVEQHKTYKIFPQTNANTHYPILFIEPYNPTTVAYGFDLASDPVRLKVLETARDTGRPAVTEAINLNSSQGPDAPLRSGFFITVPIYKTASQTDPTTTDQRRAAIFGFVNIVFETSKLFDQIFHDSPKNASYVLSSESSGNTVYSRNAQTPVDSAPKQQDIIEIGGQRWILALYTASDFGVTGAQQRTPRLILISGTLLAILGAALLIVQARQRQKALQLASSMTEDLNNERNTAVLAKEKDDAILSSIGDAVFAINPKGEITLFNPRAEALTGYSSNEALGRPYKEILKFINEKDRSESDEFILSALKGRLASMKSRTKLIRKDGSEIYVADSAAPIHDARKILMGAIVVFRDITSEHELDKAKSEFVSLASHQLRTPLSAVNWYAEMLLDGTLGKMSKDQLSQVQEIYDGNQRMIELVNSLLDVSRLDLGKLFNKPESTDMLALATSLEKELATSIDSKAITLTKQISADLPDVSADPKLLRMILQNLLSNSVKYTPAKGKITLAMRPASEHEVKQQHIKSTGPHLFISVEDTGYGIPAVQQGNIFQKMFRADNVRKLDVEGTGLGLYIVREVAVKLGGNVWFTSVEGKGTTFYVILPFTTKPSGLSARSS